MELSRGDIDKSESILKKLVESIENSNDNNNLDSLNINTLDEFNDNNISFSNVNIFISKKKYSIDLFI